MVEVLEESKRFGFLGPGPVVDHIDHAAHFVAPLDRLAGLRHLPADPLSSHTGGPDQLSSVGDEPDQRLRFVDLGAGGGLPSLPILVARREWQAVLLDASR